MTRAAIALGVLFALAGCNAVSVTGGWCQFPADCHRPNECALSRCRAPCTDASQCPTGLCLAGHCSVPEDEGCATIPGRTCASTAVCAEDRCTIRCTSSCANGATCRPAAGETFSICAAPGSTTPDAGTTTDGG